MKTGNGEVAAFQWGARPLNADRNTSLRGKVRDWWRGYTAADIESVRAKLSAPYREGEIVWMSKAEMRAMQEVP